MDTAVKRPIVFISHIGEEKEIALELKALLQHGFPEAIDVFVSSDYSSVELGSNWLDGITSALKSCSLEIILCSPTSIERPWINFEAGAGWIRDILVIPLCHSGLEPADLAFPLKLRQGAIATDKSSLDRLIKIVSGIAGSEVLEVDFGQFVNVVSNFVPGDLFSMITGKRTPPPSLPDLSEEAQQLLIEVSQDPNGSLLAVQNEAGGDVIVQTHGKSFCNTADARVRTAWMDAVFQLNRIGLIRAESKTKYAITTWGYNVADEYKLMRRAKSG